MKVKTLIVDDEPLAIARLKDFLKNSSIIIIIGEAQNGPEAIKLIEEKDPDLVLLDIHLPIMNGFQVLQKITKSPKIIFTTAYDEYAIKAFEVNAVDYLLKPFSKERLEEAVHKTINQYDTPDKINEQKESLIKYNQKHENYLNRITVKKGFSYKVIDVKDVTFFKIENGLVFMHTEKEKHIVDISLSTLEKRLNPLDFFRCHRKAIVNLNKIEKIIPWSNNTYILELTNQERVELARERSVHFKHIVGLKL